MSNTLTRRHCIGTVAYMGGIPAIPAPFVWSWTQLLAFNEEAMCQENEYVHYVRAQMSLHSAGRSEIAGQLKGDWVLMLDCDMTFDPDTCARLVRLMRSYDLDVVSGMYPYKSLPSIPVAFMRVNGGRHEALGDWPDDVDLFQVDSVGLGCCLISRRILERIIVELHEDPFAILPPLGEDHSFFNRVARLGAKLYCAPHILPGHISQTPLYLDANCSAIHPPRGRSFEVDALTNAKGGCLPMH
jgi:hypothetical protein